MDLLNLNTVQILQLVLGSLSFIVLVVAVRIHQYNSDIKKCIAFAESVSED